MNEHGQAANVTIELAGLATISAAITVDIPEDVYSLASERRLRHQPLQPWLR
jgi:hypothetical protein